MNMGEKEVDVVFMENERKIFGNIHGKCKWFERSLDIAVFFFFVLTPH